ncbi:hypothetical protein [Rhodothalassium salexigens]|uniref:hypothetical protein n=1 Tax=Rhodothalassium salexigens TaxID=1086 RepID=UPI0010534BFF|nr:hypothetical protein [Rhodothalassium salexigens]MBB4211686.1 hypothetical protein [Rhodothalassium salexigens DSM 2132]
MNSTSSANSIFNVLHYGDSQLLFALIIAMLKIRFFRISIALILCISAYHYAAATAYAAESAEILEAQYNSYVEDSSGFTYPFDVPGWEDLPKRIEFFRENPELKNYRAEIGSLLKEDPIENALRVAEQERIFFINTPEVSRCFGGRNCVFSSPKLPGLSCKHGPLEADREYEFVTIPGWAKLESERTIPLSAFKLVFLPYAKQFNQAIASLPEAPSSCKPCFEDKNGECVEDQRTVQKRIDELFGQSRKSAE